MSSDLPSAPSKRCSCGGAAWSLEELVALCESEGKPDEARYWRSVLGPGSYYCTEEDDVLFPGEET